MSTVLLSGASGFIGSALAKSLVAHGHEVVRLARRESKRAPSVTGSVRWDPEAGTVARADLAELRPDVVINLAGEPIAHRWTSRRRRRIRESRVTGTRALAEALAAQAVKPKVLISGSAIGWYGAHRGDEILTEESTPGSDFLAETAQAWEHAAAPAQQAGIRVVLARTGIVLGRDGGALARMLLPFHLGVGGRLGSGKQWMSWISLGDIVRALMFLMESPTVSGPVNLVGPEPERNAAFAKALGHALNRPSAVPVPAFVLHLLFGSMARHTILASQRVAPRRLADAGFEYRHSRLEDALHAELRR